MQYDTHVATHIRNEISQRFMAAAHIKTYDYDVNLEGSPATHVHCGQHSPLAFLTCWSGAQRCSTSTSPSSYMTVCITVKEL